MKTRRMWTWAAAALALAAAGCGPHRTYQNRNMDFASVKSIVVMPFWNMSKEQAAGDRVRDVFSGSLLATQAVYVIPTGEVARAISRLGVAASSTPSAEEVVKICSLLKADAVITGVVREYGELRSTTAAANVISLSLQMQEGSTGKVVWAGASTQGGIGLGARLLGSSGGEPMNEITEQAVDDLLGQLFH